MSESPTVPPSATTSASVAGDADIAAKVDFVWSEALRALERQEQNVDELRSRAGTLVSAATIATSFLGVVALGSGGWTVPKALAVVLFGGCVACCLAVLWPWNGWVFRNLPRKLLAIYVEPADPMSLTGMKRDVALHAEDDFVANGKKMLWLQRIFAAGIVLLACETGAWLWALA